MQLLGCFDWLLGSLGGYLSQKSLPQGLHDITEPMIQDSHLLLIYGIFLVHHMKTTSATAQKCNNTTFLNKPHNFCYNLCPQPKCARFVLKCNTCGKGNSLEVQWRYFGEINIDVINYIENNYILYVYMV